ncbi:type II toxin-antitoxin system RatA family toxin [Seminibacterium arietis]|uniref:Type II toxin-antitoxin system RatA family toxin n=1 Tax=Seminibacterium arietis TaxID=1173502 RepID=A0ABW3IA49_9PAST
MPSVNKSALVPYSAKQMYDLVHNYERYPEFVPGCISGSTISKGEKELIAELVISKAGIRQRFTTKNTMIENRSIKMQLVEGPFRFLRGEWRFNEIDEQCCQIGLELEFEFSNSLVSFTFGKIFHHLTISMIEAFKQRAKAIYQ